MNTADDKKNNTCGFLDYDNM